MKRSICILLVLVIFAGLCACGGQGGSTGKTGLQAGFGREKILPKNVTDAHIAGSDAANRVATGYMDELCVTCVALKEGDETVLIYTLDMINSYNSVVELAKKAITELTGVPADRIIMNATHTHSGVAMTYDWDGVVEYNLMFNEAVAKAAETAIADLSAAQVYSGSTETEDMTFVRHYKLSNGTYYGSNYGNSAGNSIEGHAYEGDTELQVVKFARAAEDKKDIVLVSFPAHATMNSISNRMTLSADFPSPTREYIEANSDSLVAYFIGAAGDQTPSSRIAGEEFTSDYKVYGERLGKYVIDFLPNLTQNQNSGMTLVSQTYTGKAMKEGLEKLAEAREVAEAAAAYGNSNGITVSLAAKYGFDSVYEAKAVVSRAKAPETRTMVLKALVIGDLSFVFAPYEMFSQQSHYIKDNSPYKNNTVVITCGEGAEGYLPSEMGFTMKCYEVHVTKYVRGTAEDVAKTFVDMLAEIKGAQ